MTSPSPDRRFRNYMLIGLAAVGAAIIALKIFNGFS